VSGSKILGRVPGGDRGLELMRWLWIYARGLSFHKSPVHPIYLPGEGTPSQVYKVHKKITIFSLSPEWY